MGKAVRWALCCALWLLAGSAARAEREPDRRAREAAAAVKRSEPVAARVIGTEEEGDQDEEPCQEGDAEGGDATDTQRRAAAGARGASESDPDSEAEAEAEPDPEAEPESGPDPDPDSESGPDPASVSDPEPDSLRGTDSRAGSEADPVPRTARGAAPRRAAAVVPDAAPLRPTLEHRVARGETLSAVAARYGIALSTLLADNPGLAADRVREGQRLRIGSDLRRVLVEVRPGQTLSSIASAHEITLAELLRENPGLGPDHVRAGTKLSLLSRAPESPSVSIGSPSRGRLQAGRQLPDGRGYVIRERARAFGTDETVRALVASFAQLAQRYPSAPRLAIHDISLRGGGKMSDHKSHQSGRDADVAYPRKHCGGACEFEHIAPSELDAARAFTLLRYLLEREQLEAVFVDYRLQKPLYEAARAQGASAEQLARWFQYPRGRGDPSGVIRHFPKHADHMHLRFRCDDSDLECRSFRPSLLQTAAR